MATDFERVQGNQKRVMAQLREINVDGIKMDMSKLETEMAKKTDIEDQTKKLIGFNEVITKMNKTVSEVEKECSNTTQYTNRRIEGSRDILTKHTEQIEALQKDTMDIRDVVMKSKRSGANANSLRAKLEAQASVETAGGGKTDLDAE